MNAHHGSIGERTQRGAREWCIRNEVAPTPDNIETRVGIMHARREEASATHTSCGAESNLLRERRCDEEWLEKSPFTSME